MKNQNHFFGKPFSGTGARHGAGAISPYLLVLIFSGFLFQVFSCKKDGFEVMEEMNRTPLFSQDNTSNATNIDLSYDVVIKRSVAFQNGLSANSPGWKKIQTAPEIETYSLEVNIDNGNFYLLQDNIVVRSYYEDQLRLEDKINKMEITNGICTSYDSLGAIISSLPVGDMASAILDGLDATSINTPIDTNALAADSIPFHVNGNRLLTWKRLALGDDQNSTTYLDMGTGATILEYLYDENDATRIKSVASHGYSDTGIPLWSKFTHYDYLSDGDKKRTDEHWVYSNFSINFF